MSENTPDAALLEADPSGLRLPRPPQFVSSWVSFVTSVISLATAVTSILIATYTFLLSGRPPEVVAILPQQVRVTQGGSVPVVYLQPTFLRAGRSNRTEILSNMHLEIVETGAAGSTEFEWNEYGTWSYDAQAQELTYVYLGDPVPLLVSPDAPQQLTALFHGPPGWQFAPGAYRITLVADRAVAAEPLRASFTVTFSEDEIEFLNTSGGSRFLTFPVGGAN